MPAWECTVPKHRGHSTKHRGRAPDQIAIIHVVNRVVRRCFLLGDDPVTGKNFDHRKVWIEESPAILERLQLDALTWCELVRDFGRLFNLVAGRPQVIDAARSRGRQSRFSVPRRLRELLPN